MNEMQPRTVFLVALAALLACSKGDGAATDQTGSAAAAGAEASPQGGPITEREVRDYRLSLDRMRTMHRAEMEWARTAPPPKDDADDGSDADDVTKDPTTTDGANEMLREMQKRPDVMAAIRKSGVEPKEVAIHTMVLAMSSMFAATGTNELPPDIAPENVAFAKANMAEIQRNQKQREALMDSVKAARSGQ